MIHHLQGLFMPLLIFSIISSLYFSQGTFETTCGEYPPFNCNNTASFNRDSFNKGFLFGVASSAYQALILFQSSIHDIIVSLATTSKQKPHLFSISKCLLIYIYMCVCVDSIVRCIGLTDLALDFRLRVPKEEA